MNKTKNTIKNACLALALISSLVAIYPFYNYQKFKTYESESVRAEIISVKTELFTGYPALPKRQHLITANAQFQNGSAASTFKVNYSFWPSVNRKISNLSGLKDEVVTINYTPVAQGHKLIVESVKGPDDQLVLSRSDLERTAITPFIKALLFALFFWMSWGVLKNWRPRSEF